MNFQYNVLCCVLCVRQTCLLYYNVVYLAAIKYV